MQRRQRRRAPRIYRHTRPAQIKKMRDAVRRHGAARPRHEEPRQVFCIPDEAALVVAEESA